VEELEPRRLLAGMAPTPVDQLFLEQLNDARANPAAYGASIGLDLSYIAPAPPLAWDARLEQAATLDAQDMNNRAFFAHVNPDGLDPGQRIANASYPAWTWGESITAGSALAGPADALRTLIIDQGVADLGHRNHLLANGSPNNLQRQVGIGIVQGGSGPYQNYYVIDTATVYNSPALLAGVVFNDANGNGQYDIGEGLGGVTISVAGVGSTTTFDSGGYSLPLPPGTYTVTAQGGALGFPVSQVVTVGTDNVRLNFTAAMVSAAEARSWVTLLYRDLLRRTPAASEVNPWVSAMQNGLPRGTVVNVFLHSWEYNADVVTGMYQKYLHRAPDSAGLNGFTTALVNGFSEAWARQLILGSPEYAALHGGTPAGLVQGLYTDLLGRSPSGHEADGWINLVKDGNAATAVGGLVNSWEADADQVQSIYSTFLRRSADPAGLNSCVAYLQATQDNRSLLAIFLNSPEYLAGSLTW
jgi:hypothetical protein